MTSIQVGVEHRPRLDLAARHQVPVAVERDRDRRVAQVGAQGLGVQSGSDSDAGVGVSALVESEWLQSGFLPARVDAATQDAGVGRPRGVVETRKEQALAGVVEQNEMIGEKYGELRERERAQRSIRETQRRLGLERQLARTQSLERGAGIGL